MEPQGEVATFFISDYILTADEADQYRLSVPCALVMKRAGCLYRALKWSMTFDGGYTSQHVRARGDLCAEGDEAQQKQQR